MKESWNTLGIKDKLAILSAIAAFTLGWILTVWGFVETPRGEVAESVLWILGQSLIYSASVFGVAAYFNSETIKMKRDFKRYVRNIEKEETDDGEE